MASRFAFASACTFFSCSSPPSFAKSALFASASRALAIAGGWMRSPLRKSRFGFMACIERAANEVVLVERNCPIAAVASRFPILCEHEAALHGRVLGRKVALRSCCARGDEVCRFEIDPVCGNVRSDSCEEDEHGPSASPPPAGCWGQ